MKKQTLLIIMAMAGIALYAQDITHKADSIMIYAANRTLLEKEIYRYDSLGSPLVKTVDNYLWKTKTMYSYEYNDKHLPVSVVHHTWDKDKNDWVTEKKITSEYDANDNLSETAEYLMKGKDWNLWRSEKSKADKNKKQIVATVYNGVGKEVVKKRTNNKYVKKIQESKSVNWNEGNKWREAELHLYKYDAENRLVEEEYHDHKDAYNPMIYKYVYKYDADSRRERIDTFLSSANRKEWALFNYALYFYK